MKKHNFLMSESGYLCTRCDTFHEKESLIAQAKSDFNRLTTGSWYYGWYKKIVDAKIIAETGNRNVEDVSVLVKDTFDTWVEREGLEKIIWGIFQQRLLVYENMPDQTDVQEILVKPWWDFRSTEFAFSEEYANNCISSVNPVATNMSNYIGTLEDVLRIYGRYPVRLTLIANSMTPEQQLLVNTAVSDAHARDDRQGCVYVDNLNWDIIYI